VKRRSGPQTSGSTQAIMMNPRRFSWLLAPVHAAALLSAAKSFRANPILGRNALNHAGLHVARVRMAAARRAPARAPRKIA